MKQQQQKTTTKNGTCVNTFQYFSFLNHILTVMHTIFFCNPKMTNQLIEFIQIQLL